MNFDSQDGLDGTVTGFCEFLNGVMAPFFELKQKNGEVGKNNRNCERGEDKPWFNDACRQLYCQYMRCLNIFNHDKNYVNHANLNIAKNDYKTTERKLKRIYRKEEGNMLEGLKRINPKLFYRMFANKRRVTPKASVKDFFEHFKKVASELNGNIDSADITVNSDDDHIPVYDELDRIITNEEILCAIKNLKKSKSYGIDGL